ncbi:MAG TPA: amidase [Firmicutes bacterium]|jgi:hypothetical protein|nr:amidase [Bacillota bacterium]
MILLHETENCFQALKLIDINKINKAVKILAVLKTKPYNREDAVQYATRWALGRNPRFYDYTNLGGDCTSFASQVIFSGATVMNYTHVYGWYYINGNEKSPSWTGVDFLYQFLIRNREQGPFAQEVSLSQIQPGDIIQIFFGNQQHYNHSLAVTKIGFPNNPDQIFVATHTPDFLDRKFSSYQWVAARYLHILGVNM